ncbi:MAG: AraC family transcriptional regulator [Deltaproteobacteria bacterium]|nr:AraC family transcriptional regulator [Deltaproteobacteria bacterium]MBW1819919.1 AraC family transcriptional regulator [Deltaproteobacteria bacterium]MBW2283276.1 AraC family transcriptional regulator [Deltaproteobacteria bacterium]
MLTPTIPTIFIREVLEGVLHQGFHPAPLLRIASIPPALFDEPMARISAEQYAGLIKVIARQTGDEFLGFLTASAKPGTFAMMCYALIGCDSLEKILRRFIVFMGLFTDELRWELTVKGSQAEFCLDHHDILDRVFSYVHYGSLFLIHRLSSWYLGRHIPLKKSAFAFADPGYRREYDFLFPGAHQFVRHRSCITFDARYLSMLPIRTEEALEGFLPRAMVHMLTMRVSNERAGARVRMIMGKSLKEGLPKFETVAQRLNTTSPTLSRRLREEGTSFQAIKDEVRRDFAINQLMKGVLSIEEIADLIGFSEASAFHKAFRRWTGVTPGAYRQALTP